MNKSKRKSRVFFNVEVFSLSANKNLTGSMAFVDIPPVNVLGSVSTRSRPRIHSKVSLMSVNTKNKNRIALRKEGNFEETWQRPVYLCSECIICSGRFFSKISRGTSPVFESFSESSREAHISGEHCLASESSDNR